ncbi:hypothetical protein [Cupriavidus necator]|uniref:hypothetical protein n=1 Tax=Cupriavidus necator TaxID=106590 RepID=UPI00068FFD89|nr:hypothetical protein [Cupriavidus necator]
MSNDLNFHKAYTPPAGGHVDLNFSLNPDGVPTIIAVQLTTHAPTLQIAVTAEKAKPVEAALTMTLHTTQTLHVQANYDNRVFRGPSHATNAAYQDGAHLKPGKTQRYENAISLKPVRAEPWQDGRRLEASKLQDWQQAARQRAITKLPYQAAAPLDRALKSPFEYAPHIKVSAGNRWQEAAPLKRMEVSPFENGRPVKPVVKERHQEAKSVYRRISGYFQPGRRAPHTTKVPWQEAKRPAYGHEQIVVPPFTPPFEGDTDLNFVCPWLDYAGDDIRLNFAKYQCDEEKPPEPGETVIVPVKRVYIVLNTVMLRRVDGNVELPTFSLSLSIDADSWTWGFNAALPPETLGAIEPGSDGTPVELEAVINGTGYRVLAEQISRDRTFGRSAIRVSGKGKSAILGAPYAPVQNFSNSTARTAQQLMNDALTINGASIGWTVNWALTDWLVPAGAWSHQGTYITALNQIAGAAGAYIQPHPSQKALTVLARYPTAPWNWSSVTPDFELPADVTTRESIEWLERPRYNRVFVSGEGQGVLGQVTRGGTAGDILAPMVTDALITHVDAARQHGLAVLGDTGRQAHLALRLPVLAETGVITPGKFVRYVDGGFTRLGIVRSTSVDVSMPEVFQTIGVETHVATA